MTLRTLINYGNNGIFLTTGNALAWFLSDSGSERLVALVDLYESYEAQKVAEATCTKFCRTFGVLSPFRLQIMKDVVRALERSSWQLRKTVAELVYNIFHGFAITLNEEGFGQALCPGKNGEPVARNAGCARLAMPELHGRPGSQRL